VPVQKSVSFTENLTTDRLIYKSRPKQLDMFSDSESDSGSDDGIPALIEPISVVPPLVALALVAPVPVPVPVAPVPVPLPVTLLFMSLSPCPVH
jgi:hypothetical protein